MPERPAPIMSTSKCSSSRLLRTDAVSVSVNFVLSSPRDTSRDANFREHTSASAHSSGRYKTANAAMSRAMSRRISEQSTGNISVSWVRPTSLSIPSGETARRASDRGSRHQSHHWRRTSPATPQCADRVENLPANKSSLHVLNLWLATDWCSRHSKLNQRRRDSYVRVFRNRRPSWAA